MGADCSETARARQQFLEQGKSKGRQLRSIKRRRLNAEMETALVLPSQCNPLFEAVDELKQKRIEETGPAGDGSHGIGGDRLIAFALADWIAADHGTILTFRIGFDSPRIVNV